MDDWVMVPRDLWRRLTEGEVIDPATLVEFAAAPQQTAEPVADQYEQAHQKIVGRYRVEKRSSGYWSHCVKAGDGTGELFVGHKHQCEKVAAALQTACLDGAWIAAREVKVAPRITSEQAEPVAYPMQEYLPDMERQALDKAVTAMAAKLYRKYLEGYRGFENCSEEHLNALLHGHLAKGDPIDVANFAAFLHFNGQRVTEPLRIAAAQQQVEQVAFDVAWKRMEDLGYDYGEDALEQVRLGYELALETNVPRWTR